LPAIYYNVGMISFQGRS